MSDEKLDELSKALATTTSRRQMLKVLAATAAGEVTFVGAREAGGPVPKGRAAVSRQLRVLRLLLPARHRQVRLPAGREPVQQDAALHQCDPEATFDPETCQCVCPQGTTQCGTECCSGTRSAAPAVTTARRAAHRARSAAREASARTTGPVLET